MATDKDGLYTHVLPEQFLDTEKAVYFPLEHFTLEIILSQRNCATEAQAQPLRKHSGMQAQGLPRSERHRRVVDGVT